MTQHAPASGWNRLVAWISADAPGGLLMIGAALLGFAWANSPWQAFYTGLSETVVGPSGLHLDLDLATWAADGLLAVFFFVVGVELKHELVAGSLRNPRQAAVPVLAAIGGMVVPASLYVAIVGFSLPGPALDGWAIPTATDIAFAVAVLAIFGRGLPTALRLFLLTLAVVDDLLAIIVIALFYSDGVSPWAFLAAAAAVAAFGLAARAKRLRWWVLVPLALIAWVLMHDSGVHATIAGVLLGLSVPARAIRGEAEARTKQFEHGVGPLSAGVALPLFAFFAAGVSLSQDGGVLSAVGNPVTVAIVVALVLGKLVGVIGVTALVTRTTPLRLPDSIGIRDLLPVGFLTGIGFTVSLLIAELSFKGTEHAQVAKFAVLTASLIAALLAGITLRWDARKLRKADMNEDGIVDLDQGLIGDERRSEP